MSVGAFPASGAPSLVRGRRAEGERVFRPTAERARVAEGRGLRPGPVRPRPRRPPSVPLDDGDAALQLLPLAEPGLLLLLFGVDDVEHLADRLPDLGGLAGVEPRAL